MPSSLKHSWVDHADLGISQFTGAPNQIEDEILHCFGIEDQKGYSIPDNFNFIRGPKSERQLYVGNLPVGISPDNLVKFMNKALLIMRKYLYQPGLPILSTWIAQDGHYCFVEFRNPEEMALGYSLNQVTILGSPLKVGKTKNSLNDSMKYLSLIRENKENARRQKMDKPVKERLKFEKDKPPHL